MPLSKAISENQRTMQNAKCPSGRRVHRERGKRLRINSLGNQLRVLYKKQQSHGERKSWDLKLEESFILLVGYLGT